MRFAKTISRYPLRLLRFALDVAAADTDYSPWLRKVVRNHAIPHPPMLMGLCGGCRFLVLQHEVASAQPHQHQRKK